MRRARYEKEMENAMRETNITQPCSSGTGTLEEATRIHTRPPNNCQQERKHAGDVTSNTRFYCAHPSPGDVSFVDAGHTVVPGNNKHG